MIDQHDETINMNQSPYVNVSFSYAASAPELQYLGELIFPSIQVL